LYARLWRDLADEPRVAPLVEKWHWDVPLRLLAALHDLVLRGDASWDDLPGALERHADFLRWAISERPVQTNEVQRCWMLLPCFLEIARRTGARTFDVLDLGTAAGLNLLWDRYRYRYGAGEWGPADALLALSGEERRSVPRELLDFHPQVRRRIGVDLAPIDVTTEEGARLLRSFVWADQTWRLDQLDRAIGAVGDDPPELLEGDVVEVVPEVLARRDAGALMVVVNTAALGYVPAERRTRVLDAIADAGDLAYVASAQPPDGSHLYWGFTITIWPDGEREFVANGDFHGAWLEWLR
jgi:hypothetical protein